VDPAHAELAELALLLADTAPRPAPEFVSQLDRRVARRFEPVPAAAGAKAGLGIKAGPARARRRLLSIWTAGPAVALVAGVAVAVVVVGNSGTGSSPAPLRTVGNSISLPASPTSGNSAGTSGSASGSVGVQHRDATGLGSPRTSAAASDALTTASLPAAEPPAASVAPTPVSGTTGKVIQSASISLTTPNDHVDQVSQEVYNVVGLDGGTVTNSQITAATQGNGGGYASFTLSFPTSNLQAAMTALSRLRFATVASRTDGTQNVGGQYNTDAQNLQQAQALRTSLLKQLQAAASQTAIDAIEAQLKTANAQIASAQSTLASLQHKISHSTVTVQINSGGVVFPTPVPVAAKHGFTIARAGHDALRVLVVSVGVALITLAVLVPVSLVVALVAWVAVLTRRRRREQALDAG
jgi:hypothetical protein